MLVGMYIDIVPNRNPPPALLLRESERKGKRVIKRTLANLSSPTLAQVQAIRAVLQGQPLAAVDAVFEIIRARAPEAVQAIDLVMGRLRISALLEREACRERDLGLDVQACATRHPHGPFHIPDQCDSSGGRGCARRHPCHYS